MGWGGVGCVNVRLHLQTKLILRWGWGGVGCVNVRCERVISGQHYVDGLSKPSCLEALAPNSF